MPIPDYQDTGLDRIDNIEQHAAALDDLGGSSPVKELTFAFDHATPSLNDGVTAYTPTAGETLLNWWVEITTPFTGGTTPSFDLFSGAYGLFQATAFGGGFVDMTLGDIVTSGVGLSLNPDYATAVPAGSTTNSFCVPTKLVDTTPLQVVVSQDGTKGGTASGATAGAAVLHLLISMPSASPG